MARTPAEQRIADQVGLDPTPDEQAAAEAAAEALAAEQAAQANGDRPEWLDDRYASVEDQARAYGEAQKKMFEATKQARAAEETAADLAERMSVLEERLQQPTTGQGQGYDPGQDPWLLAEAQAFEEGDYAKAAQLRDARTAMLMQAYAQQFQPQSQADPKQDEAITNMYALMTQQRLAQQYGDQWEGIKQGIGDLVQEHADLLPDNLDPIAAADRISLLAKVVQADMVLQGTQQQQQAADWGQRQKLQAQGLSGNTGRLPAAANPADALLAEFKKVPSGYAG